MNYVCVFVYQTDGVHYSKGWVYQVHHLQMLPYQPTTRHYAAATVQHAAMWTSGWSGVQQGLFQSCVSKELSS